MTLNKSSLPILIEFLTNYNKKFNMMLTLRICKYFSSFTHSSRISKWSDLVTAAFPKSTFVFKFEISVWNLKIKKNSVYLSLGENPLILQFRTVSFRWSTKQCKQCFYLHLLVTFYALMLCGEYFYCRYLLQNPP